MSGVRARRCEHGASVFGIAAWLAGIGATVAVVGYILVAGPFQSSTPHLSAAQQAYIQAVATQQANAYISAVATQQASALPEAPPPAPAAAQPPRAEVASAPPTTPPQQPPHSPPTVAPQPATAPTTPPNVSPPTLPPPSPTAMKQLTRYDLIDYAYSIGCNGSECTCVADTMLQHFTLDQISKQGISMSAALIAADLSKCFDPRYKPSSPQ